MVRISSRDAKFPDRTTPTVKISPETNPAIASNVESAIIAITIQAAGGSAWPDVSCNASTPKIAPGISKSEDSDPNIARR